ncbi:MULTISPECIES: Gfo/Idh/MocA family oxidoreductase [unclassified Micromonospora]|uniref:Gfo/Idh/MocA family protein n=1 Tax=unclassified Micromonospora TaxID=2617518 RepID=UPI00332FC817
MSGGDRLRVGFVSGVRHAGQYAAILAADPRVEIVGIAEEPDAPGWVRRDGERVAGELGVPWSTDVLALCRGGLDLAVICSEPVRHARLAIEALTAGVHVLVDKPVATTVPDADAVLAAADAAPGVCTVVNRTHSPAVSRLWRWVDAGHLGLPRHVDVEFLASGAHFTASVERPELVLDPALSGGGELLNFLGYAVDYIRYLTGLEIVDVYAEAGTLFDAGHAAHGVEDCAVVSLGLRNGVTATATVGRIPYAPGLGAGSSTIRLIGSHGHAVADDDLPQVLRYGNGVAGLPVAGGGAEAALTAFLTDLVGHLLAGTRPRYGVADARAAMAVIDAAYRSVATGRTALVAQSRA